MTTRTTYDVSAKGGGRPMLNFETRADAKEWIKRGLYPTVSFTIKPRKSRRYSLGDMWRSDFDYTGMIKKGSIAKAEWGLKKLNKLFDSYEDVNYHTESESLYEAIQDLERGNKKHAELKLKEFREINKKILRKWH